MPAIPLSDCWTDTAVWEHIAVVQGDDTVATTIVLYGQSALARQIIQFDRAYSA